MVKIIVTGKNVKVTNAIKGYIEEKISKLEHFSDSIIAVHVIVAVEKMRQIVEVTLQTSGSTIHVSEESEDMYKSIDRASDLLARKLKKLKEKMNGRKKQSAFSFDENVLKEEGAETEEGHHIILVDRYVRKPMDVDEAVMQLELVKNDFLVFLNATTKRVNVVYKRKDGNFGLIDPKFD